MDTTLAEIFYILLIIGIVVVIWLATKQYAISPCFAYKLNKKDYLLYAKLKIGNKKVFFLVDTGSEISFISNDLAKKISFPKHEIEHQEVLHVEGISQQLFIPIDRYCEPRVNMSTLYVFKHIFYVADLPVDGVLGMDWLIKNKAKINTRTLKMYIPKDIRIKYDLRCNKPNRTV